MRGRERFELAHELVLRLARIGPRFALLQDDVGIGHRRRHRVRGDVGGAELREHAVDLGHGREPRVELQLHADRLLDAGAGNPQRVQRDVAFVEARNELAAHAGREHGAERDDEHCDGHGRQAEPAAPRAAAARTGAARRA